MATILFSKDVEYALHILYIVSTPPLLELQFIIISGFFISGSIAQSLCIVERSITALFFLARTIVTSFWNLKIDEYTSLFFQGKNSDGSSLLLFKQLLFYLLKYSRPKGTVCTNCRITIFCSFLTMIAANGALYYLVYLISYMDLLVVDHNKNSKLLTYKVLESYNTNILKPYFTNLFGIY